MADTTTNIERCFEELFPSLISARGWMDSNGPAGEGNVVVYFITDPDLLEDVSVLARLVVT